MAGSLKLRCSRGPLSGKEFSLQPGRYYVMGREPGAEASSAIQLPSSTVSGSHARLELQNGSWVIRDMDSFNGVRVNRNRVLQAFIKPGDQIDLGEFRFFVEGDATEFPEEEQTGLTPTPRQVPIAAESNDSPAVEQKQSALTLNQTLLLWHNMDFKFKLFGLILLGGVFILWLGQAPLQSEAEVRIFEHATYNARYLGERLAEKSKAAMAAKEYFLLDCADFASKDGVLRAYILKADGIVACPSGEFVPRDSLFEASLKTRTTQDDCRKNFEDFNLMVCSVVTPILSLTKGANAPDLVGFARIDYEARTAERAFEKFSRIRIQTFLLVLLILVALALGIFLILRLEFQKLSDQVHLLFTGTAENVEKPKSFAALDELVAEINGLMFKANQGLSSGSGLQGSEADFLQPLFQQVFLLEERALMAVNTDNHILAISEATKATIPLSDVCEGIHVTEAVLDTHLQAELMGFLNELQQGSEILDRALSLSDRVVQARGMPIFSRGRIAAVLLIF